jgi:hypothetical protein
MKFWGDDTLFDYYPIIFFIYYRGTKMRMPKLWFLLNVSHLHHLACIQVMLRVWNLLPWPWEDDGWINMWNESIG